MLEATPGRARRPRRAASALSALRLYVSIFVTFLLTACATTNTKHTGSELHLLGLPVTLNLDGLPGPDGFAVRVFMSEPASAKGVPIKKGALEILMFDGVIGLDQLLSTPPSQTWKFTAQDLPRNAERTALGHGYQFRLQWNTAPTRGHITVVARYLPTKGRPFYSTPSAINAPLK